MKINRAVIGRERAQRRAMLKYIMYYREQDDIVHPSNKIRVLHEENKYTIGLFNTEDITIDHLHNKWTPIEVFPYKER